MIVINCVKKRMADAEAIATGAMKTGVQNTAHRPRGFAPRGKSSPVRLNAKRSSLGMISAINNQGKTRFLCYRKAMNTKLLTRFIGRLVRDTERKVF